MGWWVYLKDKETGETVEVDRHAEGGTCVIGGTTEAEIKITYNYYKFFDFSALDGMTGRQSIPPLGEAVSHLGTERDDNYWKKTPGNCGYMCSILLAWAEQHPEAVWEVS